MFGGLFIWKKKRIKELEDSRISEKRSNINQSKMARKNIQAEIALLKKVESMEIKKIRDSSLKKVRLSHFFFILILFFHHIEFDKRIIYKLKK